MDESELPGLGFMWLSVGRKKKGRGSGSLPRSYPPLPPLARSCTPPTFHPPSSTFTSPVCLCSPLPPPAHTLIHVHPSCLGSFVPTPTTQSCFFGPHLALVRARSSPLLSVLIRTNPHCLITFVWPLFGLRSCSFVHTHSAGATGVACMLYVHACMLPSFVLCLCSFAPLPGHVFGLCSRLFALICACSFVCLHLGSFTLNRALLGFGGALCMLSSLLYQMQT
jgi:hypothetical protein